MVCIPPPSLSLFPPFPAIDTRLAGDLALARQDILPSSDGRYNRTNIVFRTGGGWFGSVLALPRGAPAPQGAPAGTQFVMTFDDNASPGVPLRAMQLAVSPDGFHFTRLAFVPRLPESFADTSVALVHDPTTDAFVAFGREDGYPDQHPGVRCGNVTPSFNMQSVRAVRRAVSPATPGPAHPDGPAYSLLNFTVNASATGNAQGVVLGFDRLDPQCVDVYNSAAIAYNSFAAPLQRRTGPAAVDLARTTTAYVAFPSVFRHFGDAENDGVLDVRLAFSRDGTAFRYVGGDRAAWVPRGHGARGASPSLYNETEGAGGFPAAWDAGLTYMLRGAVDVGDGTLALHYFGMQGTHARAGAPGESGGLYGIGRVTLRRDGFASYGCSHPTLSAATNSTRLLHATTYALTLPDASVCGQASGPGGRRLGLWLNAEVPVGGNLTLEVQDAASGQPLLSHADSGGFAGNRLRAPAVWGRVAGGVTGRTPPSDLSGLCDRPVRLQFRFQPPAQLYAWHLDCF